MWRFGAHFTGMRKKFELLTPGFGGIMREKSIMRRITRDGVSVDGFNRVVTLSARARPLCKRPD